MIYFTSDFHFFHNKNFIAQARGFESVEEMNKMIIQNYNSVIQPEDDVYILGDIMLGGADLFEEGITLCNQLKGRIHLVRGNHDTDKRWTAFLEQCTWDIEEANNAIYLDYKHYHFYLSHYPTLTSNHDFDKPLKQRLLNICGHTHTTDPWSDYNKGYIYHCEIDANNCMPVPIDNIVLGFKNKVYEEM